MNLGKGLGLSAIGAAAGAVVWIVLMKITGMGLWFLAPIVGGAAGYGMMRGTQMRGGFVAGVGAALITVVAIAGARFYIVSEEVQAKTAVTEEDAVAQLTQEIAADMSRRRIPTLNEDGEYRASVRKRAADKWLEMSDQERSNYMGAREEQNRAASSVMSVVALIFDFGVFGWVFVALSASASFKIGSTVVAKAAAEKEAANKDAAKLAAKMREEDAGTSSAGGWRLPTAAGNDRPVIKIKPVSSEGEVPSEGKKEGDGEKREVA
jgi:hypothetical protein